jgi:hypothetical protein
LNPITGNGADRFQSPRKMKYDPVKPWTDGE